MKKEAYEKAGPLVSRIARLKGAINRVEVGGSVRILKVAADREIELSDDVMEYIRGRLLFEVREKLEAAEAALEEL